VDLRQLPSDHPVITYLVQQRRFSPSWLADTYGVAYVQSALSEFWPMQGRLYIPLMMRGRLVGWQGRYVGEADWKATGINKYYNLPRIRKSLMLYGYDEAIASKSPFVVVVEGVTDVWGVGPPAVSTLGCSLSDTQLQLLLQWKTIVVYYDPDTYNCRRSPGGQVQPPAMLRLLEKLLPAATAVGAIVHVVSPPAGTDPGTMSRTENWNHLVQAISNQQELS
jgi:DNA primase